MLDDRIKALLGLAGAMADSSRTVRYESTENRELTSYVAPFDGFCLFSLGCTWMWALTHDQVVFQVERTDSITSGNFPIKKGDNVEFHTGGASTETRWSVHFVPLKNADS